MSKFIPTNYEIGAFLEKLGLEESDWVYNHLFRLLQKRKYDRFMEIAMESLAEIKRTNEFLESVKNGNNSKENV